MSVATKDAVSGPTPSRLSLFWASTVGKKVLMALSGIVLFAYVVAHLLGNLQIYLGSDLINRYAEMLHSNEGLLWTARIILLAAVVVHAVAGFLLWLRRREARPIPYRTKENIQASTASRTMIWTGFIIAAFVIYHVCDLTLGVAHAGEYIDLNPANNVVTGFSHPVPALLYVIAMIALGFHLWHGVYSMFGSLGLSHPRYTAGVKTVAAWAATLIALANISIPVAVLTGLVHG
ncbi:MAG TPA: succinate dehydrogenase cytochrome b subunit [Anaeromyxobacteraceae bacterium]|nr:succinate dehydrogenase cytochrome b subunit [Anaeromyxobacteraceae bacterium]